MCFPIKRVRKMEKISEGSKEQKNNQIVVWNSSAVEEMKILYISTLQARIERLIKFSVTGIVVTDL